MGSKKGLELSTALCMCARVCVCVCMCVCVCVYTQVDLMGHSAGGWLGRAFIGDPTFFPPGAAAAGSDKPHPSPVPHPNVGALITLGTPQRWAEHTHTHTHARTHTLRTPLVQNLTTPRFFACK